MHRGMRGTPGKYYLLLPHSMDLTAWMGLQTQECIASLVTEILVMVTQEGGAD